MSGSIRYPYVINGMNLPLGNNGMNAPCGNNGMNIMKRQIVSLQFWGFWYLKKQIECLVWVLSLKFEKSSSVIHFRKRFYFMILPFSWCLVYHIFCNGVNHMKDSNDASSEKGSKCWMWGRSVLSKNRNDLDYLVFMLGLHLQNFLWPSKGISGYTGVFFQGKRVTAMFSATFPRKVQSLTEDFLVPNYIFLTVGLVGSTYESIIKKIIRVEVVDKKRLLTELLAADGIPYLCTYQVAKIFNFLQVKLFEAKVNYLWFTSRYYKFVRLVCNIVRPEWPFAGLYQSSQRYILTSYLFSS